MTVRTWMTISGLALVAMTVAVFVRLLAPVPAPPILARVGDTRIDGKLVESCWPQRGDELRCENGDDTPELVTIPSEGEIRLIVAYPAQPEEGSIEIRRSGSRKALIEKADWDDDIAYDLKPGTYEMVAEAEYPLKAKIRHTFRFRIR